MFQISTGVGIAGYFVFAVVGLFVGAVSGVLASVVFRLRVRIATDSLLGVIGFMLVWFTITQIKFRHPVVSAVIAAAMAPALHEFIRSRLLDRGSVRGS
jgi:ABC-type dipeptide/oligopeptide/nickel transport system permease subunit